MVLYEQIVGKNKDVGDVSITQTVVAKLNDVITSVFKQGLEIVYVSHTDTMIEEYFTVVAKHRAYKLTIFATVPTEED